MTLDDDFLLAIDALLGLLLGDGLAVDLTEPIMECPLLEKMLMGLIYHLIAETLP